jgi:hypothetical protein
VKNGDITLKYLQVARAGGVAGQATVKSIGNTCCHGN